MSAAILFAAAVSRDLAAIRVKYAQAGAGAEAKNKVRRILAVIAALADHPELWQEIGDGMQEAVVARHVIHYRATYGGPGRTGAVTVRILRIHLPGANSPPKWS